MPTGDDGCDQIVFDAEGVRTGQMNSKRSIVDWPTKLSGGGLGLGIDNKIQAAYRFPFHNDKDGDEIYLFGFSRGAYTVRCLADLLYNSDLPRCKFVRKIPEAYELYRDRSLDTAPKGPAAVHFRITYGDRVPIKALCCWDTVASFHSATTSLTICGTSAVRRLTPGAAEGKAWGLGPLQRAQTEALSPAWGFGFHRKTSMIFRLRPAALQTF
jgi:uncharacterized protein (DUF2235 family)